jgi:hypothetical protein
MRVCLEASLTSARAESEVQVTVVGCSQAPADNEGEGARDQ